jgi:hypothetical protein
MEYWLIGVQPDRVGGAARRPALDKRLDQRVFCDLPVFVVLIGYPSALYNSGYAIRVTKPGARQPYTPAEVLAGDLAVRTNTQRRSTCHRQVLSRVEPSVAVKSGPYAEHRQAPMTDRHVDPVRR